MKKLDEVIEYSNKLTILYVEDDQASRDMITMILEEFFKEVIVGVDGEDGYNKFLNNEIDIIITDINMPKLDGIALSKKIREKDSDIPILILTAHDEKHFYEESKKYGINNYLLKPIDLEQFADTIATVVKKISQK